MRIGKRIPKPSLEIDAFLLLILGVNLELCAGHLRPGPLAIALIFLGVVTLVVYGELNYRMGKRRRQTTNLNAPATKDESLP